MKRTIKRDERMFDAIIGADLHLREDVPTCRTDDYLRAQFNKMDFIRGLCESNGHCPFLVAGDVFDHWKPSPYLLSRCLELLPRQMIAVAGQHDLPQHSLQELHRTGLNTLVQAGRVFLRTNGLQAVLGHPGAVFGYSYGETPKEKQEKTPLGRNILLWHHMTCFNEQPWPGAAADKGHVLLRTYKGFDLIVTGDNHQQFVVEDGYGDKKRVLVNPGSMMRMTTDQHNFEPAVYGWKGEDNSVTKIPLPIRPGVVSRAHLGKEKKADRDVRMEAYIKRARKQYESKLSFTNNLKAYMKTNKSSRAVEALVWKAVEGKA